MFLRGGTVKPKVKLDVSAADVTVKVQMFPLPIFFCNI